MSFSISAPVTCVSFSRDGQCVLASTLDSKLRLMDKDTGELLNTLALCMASYYSVKYWSTDHCREDGVGGKGG